MKAPQDPRTPEVLFIDDTTAAVVNTARWASRLRAAGVDVQALRWPARWTPNRWCGISDRDFTSFHNTVIDVGRPVVIGRGDGAAITYRLMAADAVRAGVLVSARDLPPITPGTHPPLLLLDDSSTEPQLDTLRRDGICDQQAHNLQRDTAAPRDDDDANLAQYIRDWLDFHQLLTL